MAITRTAPKLTVPGSPPSTNGFGPSVPALRRRRNVPGAVLGGLLVVVCAFGVAAWAGSVGHRSQVIVVARAVPAGAVIKASDLTTARVAADHNVSAIPASDAGQVVGRVATARLVPGSLLVRGELASGPVVPAGSAVVGLALKAGMFPASLQTGERVAVVVTPTQAGSGTGSAAAGGSVLVNAATVYQTGSSPDGQNMLVSVLVPGSDAAAVAAAGAQGDVSLIVTGGS